MPLVRARWFQVYLLPGAILQSVMIGGGYGTGRELVEYFTRFGPRGGLFGMAVTFVCMALVLAVTYEFARTFRVYDYRSFFRHLLGRGWIAFEVLYVLMFLLVLAVVASAAGQILLETFGIPYGAGLLVMLAAVGLLVFFGRAAVARALAIWTVVLYALFVTYFVVALARFGGAIGEAFAAGDVHDGWAVSGFQYAMYNLSVVPAILFSARALETRREAMAAGVVAALICMTPAALFHITFAAVYPGIVDREIPVYWMMTELGIGALLVAYVVGLFGTFIETGAGFIQGVNERIDAYLLESGRPPLAHAARAAIAVAGILLSAALATFGIIALIARGYGTIAWGFFAVYVVPTMTYGVYLLARRR
jgi:uncharacterized membrane protein YkvI